MAAILFDDPCYTGPVFRRDDDGHLTMISWPTGALSTAVSRAVIEDMVAEHNELIVLRRMLGFSPPPGWGIRPPAAEIPA